ncbi:MAG: heavy metal translocating P-type ATPase [Phycisphaerales bacterium]|nr:heavy metal translocating P-type ATPase [Phycisphaerales bacterium]
MPPANSTDQPAANQTTCNHCGLPVPPGLIDPESELQFCCNGCQTVYNILHTSGLDNYYKVRDSVNPDAEPAASTGSSYEELDDPLFQSTWVTQENESTAEVELLLEGMHCAACVWLIERLPRVADGVIEARANIRRRTVCVRYNPDHIKLSAVAQSLDKLGYAAHPARGKEARELRIREDRKFLIRVALAGALAGNIMLLAIALYGGTFSGITDAWRTTFRYYSMVLGLIVLIFPGRIFFTGAIAALRTRTAHLDIPIALALFVAGVWGTVNTIQGIGEIYFDSVAVLVFLLLVGRWIQHRQQRAASDSVELMLTLTPSSATLIDESGNTKRVPIETLEAGMSVLVNPGESFPADGVITDGTTTIDNALLTGESVPIESGPSDQALAGATNLSSPVTVRVQAVGEHTRIGKLMNLVARASEQKSPVVRAADRIAGYFVVIVITLALGTFAYWAWTTNITTGIEHATALLIVTCPCALGLATPMAMSIALGRSARSGMLIKSATVLEQLARTSSPAGKMLLDKTGTLTQGATTVIDIQGNESLLPLAAAIEQSSNHPIARAIVNAADSSLPTATNITQHTAQGITGEVNNQHLTIGSISFVTKHTGAIIPDDLQPKVVRLIDRALTPIMVHASPSNSIAIIGVGDQLRDDAQSAASDLQQRGWELSVCSGDHPRIVETIANQLNIESHEGGVTPETKAQRIAESKEHRHSTSTPVVMVGDGINDAAALASADVGIAVHGGAEASLEAADVYLVHAGLSPIVKLIDLSRSTMSTIRLCMVVSIMYNTIAATLAVTGVIDALIAAILMPISSLTVVAICTRAGKNTQTSHQPPEPR